MKSDEGSGRGFSKKRFPYHFEKSYHSTNNQNRENKTKSDRYLRKSEAKDRTWSYSKSKNSIIKFLQWGRLGEQIDHHFDITNRQLNLPILGPVSIFKTYLAKFSNCTLATNNRKDLLFYIYI